MAPKRSFSIFISYASEDWEEAADLAFYLAYDGFDPWIDRQKLMPGEIWDLEVKKAIEECHVAIICLSNSSVNKRGYLQKELRKVLDVADEIPEGEIFVIPIRFESCPIPNSLKSFQWVNLFEGGGYEKLRDVLRSRAEAAGIRVSPIKDPSGLTGVYAAQGTNWDGSGYEGVALIMPTDDTYRVVWTIADDKFLGEGRLDKNKFTITGEFNFSYRLRRDGTLRGEWEPGATETLTRIPPNARFVSFRFGKFVRIRRRNDGLRKT